MSATGQPASVEARPSGAIQDLSYRGYDGPLVNRWARWWVVALANIRPLKRRAWFWVVAALCLFPYLIPGLVMYQQASNTSVPRMQTYASSFYQCISGQAFLLFLLALLVGSAAISSDNRANALQIYLSKPITRNDYLMGKWVGVFLPLYLVSAAPAVLLYLFGLLSFSQPQHLPEGVAQIMGQFSGAHTESFWGEDHLLLLRVLGATLVGPVIHTSIVLGCSAWTKASRVAGGAYAVIYLLTAILAGIVFQIRRKAPLEQRALIRHSHVSGVIDGIVQHIYGVTPAIPRMARDITPELPMPGLGIMLGIGLLLVALGIGAALIRIRAVEVVQG